MPTHFGLMPSVRIESCEVNVNIWTIMITSRRHLEFCIKADMIMNRGYFNVPLKKRLLHLVSPDYIMEFLKTMRKVQYYLYNRKESCWGDFAYNQQIEIFQIVTQAGL